MLASLDEESKAMEAAVSAAAATAAAAAAAAAASAALEEERRREREAAEARKEELRKQREERLRELEAEEKCVTVRRLFKLLTSLCESTHPPTVCALPREALPG